MDFFEHARATMVASQIRPNHINHAGLIKAFETIPRHLFVPEVLKKRAYSDGLLFLADHSYMVSPMVLGRLIQESQVTPSCKVLDIHCGLGYSTGILAMLASTVIGVDLTQDLISQGDEILRHLKIKNAALHKAEGAEGYADGGLYDVIFIAGGVEMIPDALVAQLQEGGRLVTILYSPEYACGKAVRYLKMEGTFLPTPLFETEAPLLPGFIKEHSFVF